jgi:leucyl aminopeptidase
VTGDVVNSSVKVVSLDKVASPLLAVAIGELTSNRVPSSLLALDAALSGAVKRVLDTGDFAGKRDEVIAIYPAKRTRRVILVGMGPQGEITRGAIRRSAAVAARRATMIGAQAMAMHVVPESRGGVSAETLGQVLTEGIAQGAWSFTDFKATDETKKIEALDIIVTREERAAVERGRKTGAAIATGHTLARNLQALPGNVCTPTYLADVARKLGKAYGYKVTVLGRSQIAKEEMGGLLAVAQGTAQEPQFIALEYRGAGSRARPICVVGKGVTFDSGGISIKPAEKMEEMKYDMSGAAAVLGLFETLGHLAPKANVVGLVPATENLPAATAIKPGDIVRGQLGKTIEIVNTDAEGRLILSDALSYARRYKPACVVDAATLTGSVVIALGHHATGLMGNDDPLLEEVRRAGDLAGERCWPLPLWDEYREQLKSDVADVKNVGGRPAGSITAGWFLREFVDGFPWAHLDIAGTAYVDGDRPDLARGPAGTGVRLFAELVLGRSGG